MTVINDNNKDKLTILCRASGCNHGFASYAGRIKHEKAEHPELGQMDPLPDKATNEDEKNTVADIDESGNVSGMVPEGTGKKFPRAEDIKKQKENEEKNLPMEAFPTSLEGGPIFLMIKSLAHVLSLAGEEDYWKALEDVEKELKWACRRISGKYLEKLNPVNLILLLVVLAWTPLIIKEIIFNWGPKLMKWYKKSKAEKGLKHPDKPLLAEG